MVQWWAAFPAGVPLWWRTNQGGPPWETRSETAREPWFLRVTFRQLCHRRSHSKSLMESIFPGHKDDPSPLGTWQLVYQALSFAPPGSLQWLSFPRISPLPTFQNQTPLRSYCRQEGQCIFKLQQYWNFTVGKMGAINFFVCISFIKQDIISQSSGTNMEILLNLHRNIFIQ